jgi:hypothetical protein
MDYDMIRLYLKHKAQMIAVRAQSGSLNASRSRTASHPVCKELQIGKKEMLT